MKIAFPGILAIGLSFVSGFAAPAIAQDVRPGDVYREYVWRPSKNWARCTGPDATDSGAKAFLPNSVNFIDLKDLQDATRVEVIIEKLMSHAGTNLPRMRVNRNAWINIPEPSPSVIPGKIGEGNLKTYWYLTMRYPTFSIPMSQLQQGVNSFEFTCQAKGGDDLGRIWPQWIYYGVTFRVYYKSSKPHPLGIITSPRAGSTLGWNAPDKIKFEAQVGHTHKVAVKKVDFIGNYNDFDWRGDGLPNQFKFRYAYGQIKRHIGTGTVQGSKASVLWDATWIPVQREAFTVLARVTDANGITFVTPYVNGLELRRQFTVKRYKNEFIPKKWQSRYHTPSHASYTTVNESLAYATKARLVMSTWNGYEAEGIGINNRQMTYNIGYNHDLKYDHLDIPASAVIRGRNTMYTYSKTLHHGIEVQWPGIELFVKFSYPESQASSGVYGSGCAGSNGLPTIAALSTPRLGQKYVIGLTNAKANTGLGLLTGLSNTKYGPFDLPTPLYGAGAPGCFLLTSADFGAASFTDAMGTASISVQIPNDRRFIGASLFHQWAIVDGAVNSLGASFSNGLRMSVGDY